MPSMTLPEVVSQAKTDGFKITPIVTAKGVTLYQIFDAAGEYICTGTSEANAVKRALFRGLLSIDAENGRKVRREVQKELGG